MPSSFSRRRLEYIVTFIVEALNMSSLIGTIRISRTSFGETGMSTYLIVRRYLGLVTQGISLGMTVGLPRYLASMDCAKNEASPRNAASYLSVAIIFASLFAALVVVVMLATPRGISFLLLGNAKEHELIRITSWSIVGLTAHNIAYGYLRGVLHIYRANTLQCINHCICPLIIISTVPTMDDFFKWYGVSCLLASAGGLLASGARLSLNSFRTHVNDLIVFGVRRLPGEFALTALFTIPPAVAAHGGDLKFAGYVALGLSFISMVGSALAPLGVLFLPHASRAFSTGQFTELRKQIINVFKVVSALLVLGVVVWQVTASAIMRAYLGETTEGAIFTLRILSIAAPPFGIYVCLRNFIDAIYEKSVNGTNIFVALATFVVVVIVAQFSSSSIQQFSAMLGCVVALYTLGGLTLLRLRSAFASRLVLERE